MANDYSVKFQMEIASFKWNYIFYRSGNNADEVIQAVCGDKEKEHQHPLIAAIRKLHSEHVTLRRVIAANLDGKRKDFRPRTVLLPGTVKDEVATTTVDEAAITAVPVCAELLLYGAEGGSRHIYISGLAKADVEFRRTGTSQPKAAFITKCTTLATRLNEAGLLIQIQEDDDVGTKWELLPVVRVESLPDITRAQCKVVYRAATERWLAKDKVEFLGITRKDLRLQPLKGKHIVIAGAMTTDPIPLPYVILQTQYAGSDTSFFPLNLRMRGEQYDYQAIQPEADFVRFGSRQRGGTATPRGRAPGRSFRTPVV